MNFAIQGAQDNGAFFTPPYVVRTIVKVIELDHDIVFDPARGSDGMFVRTWHSSSARSWTPPAVTPSSSAEDVYGFDEDNSPEAGVSTP